MKALVEVTIIFMLIGLLWQVLELSIYEEITPRSVDDVIGLLFAISVYHNVKNWRVRNDKITKGND